MQIATTHKGTDFDGLASVFAAKLLYPGVEVVLPRSVNPNVKSFLSIHKDLFEALTVKDIDLDQVKRLIVVDTNSWQRLDGMSALIDKRDLEIFIWDHHDSRGNMNAEWALQEKMGANITLMIRELKETRKVLTPMQATLFLAGLYEDTGNLIFPSTQAEDAYAAAYLLDQKADLSMVGTFLQPAYGEKQKNILFQLLQNAQRNKINGHAVSICRTDISGHINNLSMVVHMYREIVNVDAAFGIFSNPEQNSCIVIGRSNPESLDIGSIMRSLGGGGHPGAGSAMLRKVQPDAVEQMIVELIQGNLQSSVQVSDLMSFPVFSVPSTISMKEVALILRKKGCTGIPVVDDGKLVGVISRRDFRKLSRESQTAAPVKAFMSTDVRTIAPGKSPMQAARLMVKYDVGRLPVVENGRIIGIITRSDTMRYFYDLLPD